MKGKMSYERLVAVISILGTVVVYALMVAFDAPCPIKYVLGVSCPGCGMTRAVLSLLRGDLAAAFYYHPLWLFVALAVVLLAVAALKRWNRLYRYTLVISIAVMIAVWLWRLFDPGCDIVSVDFDGGLIGLIHRFITGK